ncbi:toxin-antitoxin system HicB family antitoxin [Klenkia brasiliensis]|uniref:HicB family protein n=1 Tax=Klenkia brasiliensis TaxID=333142 RepID=A0A1G7ZMR1_9ACTN|nr:toxin-antitoxin system HicB family antitoxin [Klenkia brasiliensis]SDH09857.1 HicB family protein [Klenkia brasiliensis]
MDLSQYVDALRAHLRATAAAGTEQTQATAGLLADTLEPAVRLALTDALAAMAAEVTTALEDTAVDVVVRGRDPEVVVTRSAAPAAAPTGPAAPADDDEAVARISLRLPESLKTRADAAAAAAGVSLNTWLVRAVATGLQAAPPTAPRSGPGRRMSGWARS